jgi:hypothetical protein
MVVVEVELVPNLVCTSKLHRYGMCQFKTWVRNAWRDNGVYELHQLAVTFWERYRSVINIFRFQNVTSNWCDSNKPRAQTSRVTPTIDLRVVLDPATRRAQQPRFFTKHHNNNYVFF